MKYRRKKRQWKEKWGFSLVETVIVMAIIASMTAMAAPQITNALDGSKDDVCGTQMDMLMNAFQMQQSPIGDSSNNPYNLLDSDNFDYDKDENGNVIGMQMKENVAVDTLNRFLLDAITNPGSMAYIEGIQCPSTGKSTTEDGRPIYQAGVKEDELYIVCLGDGNESAIRVPLPKLTVSRESYAAGGTIRWGDTLLYIGDYENMEARFATETCKDYVMEAGFHYENHVHQDQDHKSHMGIAFNYMDKKNFCMIDFELKNGTKKVTVYQVADGDWTTLVDTSNVPTLFNVPGNGDFDKAYRFESKIKVVNSEPGKTAITFWMRPLDGSYQEIFFQEFSIAEDEKSSQYGFYIGEPEGSGNSTEFKLLDESDLENPVNPDDVETYVYKNVQVQLLSYPTFICENADDGLEGSLEPEEEDPEDPAPSPGYEQPTFTYNVDHGNQPITIQASDGSEYAIEYLWVDGIANSSRPNADATGTVESDANLISPSGLAAKTGWLWAREYDDNGHGDWVGTPWVGTDEFFDSGLKKNSDGKVYYEKSFPAMTIEYKGGTNTNWSPDKPTVFSSEDTVQAWVMHGGQQVSQIIHYSNAGALEEPIDVDVKFEYYSSSGWWMTFLSENQYSYSVEAHSVDKQGRAGNFISLSGQNLSGDSDAILLGKKVTHIQILVSDKNGNEYGFDGKLNVGQFNMERK